MANNFDAPQNANLVGLWDFLDGSENKDTGLDDGFGQDGQFRGHADADADQLHLDGRGDRFTVHGNDAPFDLSDGTLVTEFTQTDANGKSQTVVSRGEVCDRGDEGYFEIQVASNGAIVVHHFADGVAFTDCTPACFANEHDVIRVTYEWSETDGGRFLVENLTQDTEFEVETPAGLTMDIGDSDGTSFTFGARETVDEEYSHKNLENFFEGKIDYVAIYDDKGIHPPIEPDGFVTNGDDDALIDVNYTGDPNGDVVDGGDAIFSRPGTDDDIIFAGGGDDTVKAGEGQDWVDGGDGDDLIITDANILTGLPDLGFPSYQGLPKIPADPVPNDDLDTVFGGDGDDTIFTGDDADVIFGEDGDDKIDGGLDADQIDGGTGDDTIIGGEGSDTIQGGEGDDTIYGGLGPFFPDATNIPDDLPGDLADPRPDNGRDWIDGGDGDDLIFGQDDSDTLFGGAGDDTLDGGVDSDIMDGGNDRDTFVNLNQGDFVDGGEGFTNDPSDDFDTLDLTGAAENTNPGGSLSVTYDDNNPENGTVFFRDADGDLTGTLKFQNIENVIPCFTPGTRIATPRGEVTVEDLKVGDGIITRDNGIQEIRWIGSRTLEGDDIQDAAHLRPVVIKQGSLGRGIPNRDMAVSPNHRVLVSEDITALYFDESEVLVAAKHLVGRPGIEQVDVDSVTYIHFMFDHHEVILSDGAWTESFQPGDHTLAGMGEEQRLEIFEIFPELMSVTGRDEYTAARLSLKRHEAFLLMN